MKKVREFFSRLLMAKYRPVIWLATVVELITGVMLVVDPRVREVTGLKILSDLAPSWVGLAFIFAAFAAFWALYRDYIKGPSVSTFWALIPQQVLLMVSAAGVVFAIVEGHYSSGTVYSASFILTDQLLKIGIAVEHPLCMLRMHKPILPDPEVV
jgi:hypothetical protein